LSSFCSFFFHFFRGQPIRNISASSVVEDDLSWEDVVLEQTVEIGGGSAHVESNYFAFPHSLNYAVAHACQHGLFVDLLVPNIFHASHSLMNHLEGLEVSSSRSCCVPNDQILLYPLRFIRDFLHFAQRLGIPHFTATSMEHRLSFHCSLCNSFLSQLETGFHICIDGFHILAKSHSCRSVFHIILRV